MEAVEKIEFQVLKLGFSGWNQVLADHKKQYSETNRKERRMSNLVRFTGWFLWLSRPIATWAIWIARFCLALMATSAASLWVGVPTATQNLAREWQLRAVMAGVPEGFLKYLYAFYLVTAFLSILAGWIIMAHFTVWLWVLFWTQVIK